MDQIIAGVIATSYDTVSFDTEIPMTVEVDGGPNPGTIIVTSSGAGFMDMVNQTMRLTMYIDLSVPGTGSRDWETELYVVDGWIYSGVSVPDEGEEWLKMELASLTWQQQDQLGPYLALLTTTTGIDYKGTEVVNGVECYVLELEPDMDLLSALVADATASLAVMDLSALDLTELYEEISVREWLAKDSYLLQRVEVAVVLEIRPEDIGETGDDFDKLTIEVGMALRYYDYNQPFTVVLPPEALDAEDVSPETLDS